MPENMLAVHRAERADRLVGPLAGVLSTSPADPFAREVIAVPSRGVERWVSQQLALSLGAAGLDDGVAANIEFPSPTALVGDVLATVSGLDPEQDPWRGPQFVWALLDVIDACVSESWAAPLAHHLGIGGERAGQRQGRRFATAALLARLFDSYSDNRPAMLVDWAAERDADGVGNALRDDLAWQPALWRRTRELIGVPSPAERLMQVCERLQEDPGLVALPQRLSVFGATRLATTELAVLEALATGRELHLWLTHPSPAMWDKLAGTQPTVRRRSDDTALTVVNPLLANLSRDIRELQRRLPTAGVDTHYPGDEPRPVSVLTRLQDDVAADRTPGEGGLVPLDDSVTVHACHGTARQVEVLRESLLHLLDDDPTLQPRDILVLCPNIDDLAPLLAAAFAPIDGAHPGHRLRIRLADRRPGAANPLLDVVATLLELVDGRLPASDVLDLAAAAPVARRFGFGESELETLRQWAFDGGARWGLDEVQRQRFGLAGLRQNTFGQARDRILLGVLADDSAHQWLGSALPLGEVQSSDIDLAGRFAEYLDRLHAAVTSATESHTAHEWAQVLQDMLEQLTAVAAAEGWQRAQAGARIAEALAGASDCLLELADVRDALAGVLAARPTRANFRTGEITVATLVPMRFVPHRVVAIIGLDDGVFPRVGHLSGDDVLGVDPIVGERDPRSEDRQLLLDALMSAQQRVILCYTGADPVSGESRPPAAPLADVIDTIAATVTGDPDAVVRRQPLQPFDPANFTGPHPFSFDTDAFAGATAAAGRRRPAPVFLDTALSPVTATDVELTDLVDFVNHPVKAFLRQRMGITLSGKDTARPDGIPLALDGLQRWQIGDRLLAAAQADPHTPVTDFAAAEHRRGVLPPGPSGVAQLADIGTRVQVLARAFHDLAGDGPADQVDVTTAVGRWRLSGTVTGVYGDQLVSVTYSKLEPKRRLAPWVRLLALATAGYPVRRAVTIGPYRDLAGAFYAVHAVPQDPAAALEALLELRAAGLCRPLPLFAATSHAYVAARLGGSDGVRAAASAWDGGYNRPGENAEAAMVAVHGPNCPFSTVWELPIPEGQRWSAEPTWFGQLAQRVWGPLIAAETIGNTP